MGRVYLQQGQFDHAYERARARWSTSWSQRRDGDRAAALLQQIVQKNPSHVKTLNRLVEIYQQFQKEASLLATYSQLTEAYINQGQLAEAASVLEVLVAARARRTSSTRPSSSSCAASSAGRRPAPAAAVPELIEEEFDLASADEAPAPAPAPPSPLLAPRRAPRARAAPAAPPHARGPGPAPPRPPPSAIEVSGPLSDEDHEFIDEHLAEGKVFRKYGLIDKAADQFEAVVARFPDNVEARQELRDVYKEKGQPAKAAEQCLALAEIFRLQGDEAAAKKYEDGGGALSCPDRFVPRARPPPPLLPPPAARPRPPRLAP